MKKSTKIIAVIAATFVLVASVVTVSFFKSDDANEIPVSSTTLPPTTFPSQPVETVSAFDWEAYLNSLDLSTEPESSTEDPSAISTTIPVTSPSPNFICLTLSPTS